MQACGDMNALAAGSGESDEAPASAAAGPTKRRVIGFTDTSGSMPGRHSAPPPTDEILRMVREHKHSDPLRAMCAIDSSAPAAMQWRRAVARDRTRVCEELSALTETDQRWRLMRNPASVLMANLKRLGLLDATLALYPTAMIRHLAKGGCLSGNCASWRSFQSLP